MHFYLRIFMLVTVALILGFTGCGAPEVKRVKVSGTVTLGGKPMTGLPPGVRPMVRFDQEGKTDPAFAKVEDGGAFSITVVPGKYKITASSGMYPLGAPKGVKDKEFVVAKDIQNDLPDLHIDLEK